MAIDELAAAAGGADSMHIARQNGRRSTWPSLRQRETLPTISDNLAVLNPHRTFAHLPRRQICGHRSCPVFASEPEAAIVLTSYNLTSNNMTMTSIKRSPIALAVLAMLMEEPLHPYRMQQLIKERGKDEVINVTQRASLYQTIQRLEREALITPRKTIRDDKRPERTVYEITRKGRDVALDWMRAILSTPTREYPEFPAAISFLPLLSPDDVASQLELRAKAMEAELRRIDETLHEAQAVPRLFLLEMEYLRALHATELSWVTSVVANLRAQRITWTEEWLRQIATQFTIEPKLDQD